MRRIIVLALAIATFSGIIIGCGSGHLGNNSNSGFSYQLINNTGAPLRVLLYGNAIYHDPVFPATEGTYTLETFQTEVILPISGDRTWLLPSDHTNVVLPEIAPGGFWPISTTLPICNPDEPPFDRHVYSTYDGTVNGAGDPVIICYSVQQHAAAALPGGAVRTSGALQAHGSPVPALQFASAPSLPRSNN